MIQSIPVFLGVPMPINSSYTTVIPSFACPCLQKTTGIQNFPRGAERDTDIVPRLHGHLPLRSTSRRGLFRATRIYSRAGLGKRPEGVFNSGTRRSTSRSISGCPLLNRLCYWTLHSSQFRKAHAIAFEISRRRDLSCAPELSVGAG